ncbi:MAG TPA: AAA family ATPase [Micromonosporaceae bacterium]|nr:AAA family ATPase [Micromonosporaceae bacterium]
MATDDAWPFVGREPEQGAILTAAGGLRRGGVVLIGADGVGKTSLARQAQAGLAGTGWRTYWVAATRTGATIPLGALSHLVPAGDRAEDDQLTVMRRVVDLFGAGSRGAAVVVDDAHALDAASAALVYHLAARSPAFVIVTVRAGMPAPDAVTALWKDDVAARIEVPPLPSTAVADLIDRVLPGGVDGVSRAELARLAAGNPLLLRELVRAGRETGSLALRAGIWRWTGVRRVTSRLADVIAGRQADLDGSVTAALELVACGEPLPAAMLEQLVGPDVVAAAERTGLIVAEREGARTVIRFAHPGYGEVLRAGPPAFGRQPGYGRQAVYGRLATAMLSSPMRRAGDDLRAAHWAMLARMAVPPNVLLAGAGRALDRCEIGLAERLARAAHKAGGGWAASLLLAEALDRRGRYEEAAAVLPAPPGAYPDELTRWVRTRSSILYWGAGRPDAADRLLRTTPGDRLPADALRCWLLLFEGHCADALKAAADTLRTPGVPPAARVSAAAAATAAAGLRGDVDRARATYQLGTAIAGEHPNSLPWAPVQLGYAYGLGLLLSGQLAEAERLAEDGYRMAVAGGRPVPAGGWVALRGMVAKASGRFGPATALLREAVALLDGANTRQLIRLCLAELAGACAMAGEGEAAALWLRGAADGEGTDGPRARLFDAWVERNRAWVLATSDQPRRALRAARRAAALAVATQQPALEAWALYDIARLGDPRSVAGRLAQLAGTATGPLPPVLAAAAGALAAADPSRLEQASASLAGLGLLVPAAELASRAGQLHRRAGRAGPAKGCAATVATLLRECHPARTPMLDSADPFAELTLRERQVVHHAAAGRSSRDIAQLLQLSVRTIDNYLGRAYAKLGVSGRHELPFLLPPVSTQGAIVAR